MNTAAHMAAYFGHFDTLKALVEYDADLTRTNKYKSEECPKGETVLDAAKSGKVAWLSSKTLQEKRHIPVSHGHIWKTYHVHAF